MAPKNEDVGEISGGKLHVAASLLDHRDAAKRLLGDGYDAAIAPKRVILRDLARQIGGTVQDALARIMEDGLPTEVERTAWAAAAVDCVEEGQRGEVIRLDGFRPAPDQPPVPTLPGWVRRICRDATRITFPFDVRDTGIFRKWLQGGAFLEPASPQERVEGLCTVGYAFDLSFDDVDSWLFADDIIVVGWRLDERKLQSGLVESEAEKRVRQWLQEEGKAWCPRPIRKELKEGVKVALLQKCLPSRRIFPIVIHRREGWALISGPSKVVAAARKAVLTPGEDWSLDEGLHPSLRARLGLLGDHCTDLRQTEPVPVPESSAADVERLGAGALADFLLWLAITGRDTGKLSMEGTDLEWSIDGAATLWVPRGGQEGVVEVEVSSCETGPFVTSLAEGAHIAELRIALSEVISMGEGEEPHRDTFRLTLDRSDSEPGSNVGLKIKGAGMPQLPDCSGNEDVIDAEVYSRVEFYKQMIRLLQLLLRGFALVRMRDWGGVIQSGRAWVGIELEKRFVFSAETGQGWLFPPVEAPKNGGRRAKKVTVGEA